MSADLRQTILQIRVLVRIMEYSADPSGMLLLFEPLSSVLSVSDSFYFKKYQKTEKDPFFGSHDVKESLIFLTMFQILV